MIENLSNLMNAVGAEWVLWLLAALSVASIAIIVERWLFLHGRRLDVADLGAQLESLLDANRVDEARALLTGKPAMEARVGSHLLDRLDRSPEALEDLYKSAVERERLSYERFIGFLATLGSNAPFIGLFGTVLGIIAAFADLQSAAAGANRSQVIMGSISEALVATAVGLLVAIPAVMAYNAFQRRIDRSLGATEVVARLLIAHSRGMS